MWNANQIDSEFDSWCENLTDNYPTYLQNKIPSCDQSYYDAAFVFGPFDTSDDDYEKYYSQYLDYCDLEPNTKLTDMDLDDSVDCIRTGTRWLIVYKLCFAVTLIFTINALIMIVGAWSYHARMCGSCIFSLT